MPRQFTPGQKVRCIRPDGGLLTAGTCYTVAGFFDHETRYVRLGSDGPQVLLYLDGYNHQPVFYDASRFESLEDPAQRPAADNSYPVPPRGAPVRYAPVSALTRSILHTPQAACAELMAVQDMFRALAESAAHGLDNHLSRELCGLLAKNFLRLAGHRETQVTAATTIPVKE